MQIVAKEEALRNYLKTAVEIDADKPVLVDKYIRGKEVEVDAICDGKRVSVPGIWNLWSEPVCIPVTLSVCTRLTAFRIR